MQTKRPEKNHLNPLTSLRFVAAALIVVMHAQEVFGRAFVYPGFPLWQGVSFFFVLSGFILAYNYPVLASRREVLLFYTARFARVWPAHIATLLILIVFMYFRNQFTMPHIGWYVAVNALLLQSWIPFDPINHSFNAVSWSLSVELFFYLLFPLLIWNLKKTWVIKLVVGLLLIVVLVCVSNYYMIPVKDGDPWQITLPGLLAVNPLARVFEFMLGILACSIYRESHINYSDWSWQYATITEIITVLLVPLFMMLSVTIPKTTSIYDWLGTGGRYFLAGSGSAFIFAFAIFVFSVGRGSISRILSYSLAVRLGEISFALYLVHTIVLHNFAIDQQIAAHPLLWYLAYWAVCLAMAYALFIGVEQPVREIILSLAKRYIKSETRPSFPPLLFVAKPMALGGGIMLSIFAASYYARPHDLVAIQGLKALPHATTVQATFDKKVSIEAVRICSIDADTLEFAYILKPLVQIKFREILAVHFLDSTDKTIAGTGGIVDDSEPTVEQNSYWLRRIKFPSKNMQTHVSQLGLAMFIDVKSLYPVRGGNTDWNGTRIKLPLPVNWKSICESL